MEKKDSERNITFLIKEFRKKGRALKGYRNLRALILKKETAQLDRLLRNHKKEKINKAEEVIFRDETDYLLKFYSILEIAILLGFIKNDLNEKLNAEIYLILGNESVKKFYAKYYELPLVDILFKSRGYKAFEKLSNNRISLFEEFLILVNFLEDKDIETFLWFIDDGGTFTRDGYTYNINSLWDLLRDKDSIGRRLKKIKKRDPLDAALLGFVKYLNFVSSYLKLLRKTDDELIQSALWHYQAYWFVRIEEKLSSIFNIAFKNIEDMMSTITINDFNNSNSDSDLYENSTPQEDYSFWVSESNKQMEKTRNDLEEILKRKYSIPLIKFSLEFK